MAGNGDKETGAVLRFAAPDIKPEKGEEAAFGASIRKSGERAAPANEQVSGFLDRLIMDSSLPVYVSSVDGTLLHANSKFEELVSCLGDSCLAPGPLAIKGRGAAPTMDPIIQDVLSSKTTVRAEEKIQVNNREHVFLGRHMPVCNEVGDIVAVAGTYEEITRQVRALEDASETKARFQDFARASSDWFWESDAELKIRNLSDRFTAVIGQPAMMFAGSRFEQFGSFEANMEGKNEGAVAMLSRKAFRDQLFIMSDLDGNSHRFHLSGVPVFDKATGDFTGYRGVGKDVLQRYKQAERAENTRAELERALADLTRNNMALDVATTQARTALNAKNEFLAAMSHELRTPLNAIIGFAESFKAEQFGPLSADYKNYATDIHSSGRHLLELINDILDVAVMESGGLALNIHAVPLQNVLDKSVHMVMGKATEKHLNILGLSVATDLMVKADQRRLTQIFVNLLTNAVKFTQEKGSIGIKVDDGEDGFVDVTVWDNGVGIARDKQRLVFEKFQQISDNVYSRQQEGTGLGLHISRGLARAMEGDIRLESTEGNGSRFTVSLPIGDADLCEDYDFI